MDADINDPSSNGQPVIKQEPFEEPTVNESASESASYDDGFISEALVDSLRNVPDPMYMNTPRGQKNPIVTLDSIKKELHYECELCGKRFRKTADFYQHKITHGEPLNCDMCSERFFKPWDLTKHQMEKHSGSTMPKCEICSKTFIEHWRLLRHLRTHSDEKKFKCDMCDKAFSESGNLVKHKKQVHSKDRPFKCNICEKSYPQKKDLQGHMIVHTVKRFSCPFCKEEFAQIEEKRAHVKTVHPHNSNEKTFSCVLCNATFNSKTKYSNHYLTHGERNFQCRHCTKRFHTIPRLRKHLRSHRIEEHSRCEICDKSFSQDCNMKRHIEVMHMRDGRLFCLHCSQTFELADELRTHRETEHTNDRPYKCSFCEKAFSHLQSLANHSKCHRNPDRHLKEFIKPIKRIRKAPQKLNDFVDPNSVMLQDEGTNPTQSGETSNLLKLLHVKKRGRPKKNPVTATVTSNACEKPLVSQTNCQLFDALQIKKRIVARECDRNLGETPSHDQESLLEPVHVKNRGRPKKMLVTAVGQFTDPSITPLVCQKDPDSVEQNDSKETSATVTEIKQEEEEDLIDIGPTLITES
ncbi:zinc finger protein 436-like [Ochlerotatus camptorhynchus]|uniref:zinc finger protein 436-like n=1 Tax=Ochlerotatus camptorhynchus TaxID=644619 RepID=UPI0031D6D277